MRRRLALSALATLFAAALAVTGNVTTASADSSAPLPSAAQYSSQADSDFDPIWTHADSEPNEGWTHADAESSALWTHAD